MPEDTNLAPVTQPDEQPEESPVAIADDISSVPQQPSVWQRVRRWLWPTQAERLEAATARIAALNAAIEKYPESPANYVLRGEIYLQLAQYDLARYDLERALELAEEQIRPSQWGVVAQAMVERAQEGLKTLDQKEGA